MNGVAQRYGVSGLVGVRLILWDGAAYRSPVYKFEWRPGWVSADCALRCRHTPGDHPSSRSCGLHAFLHVSHALEYSGPHPGVNELLVLIECAGRVVVHERGLRAETARIACVVDWQPSGWLVPSRRAPGLTVLAADHFEVPLIEEHLAQQLIDAQLAQWGREAAGQTGHTMNNTWLS